MAKKIVLGQAPKTFKKVVQFDGLEGDKCAIEVVYKYRTRTEFGKFLDEMFEDAKLKPTDGTDDDVKRKIEQVFKGAVEYQAEYLTKIIEGWNLDAEFCFENLHALCDEYPGAALEIIETYRAAITEGRLGN